MIKGEHIYTGRLKYNYVQDPIVMKKDDLRSFLKVSCHTKFRFAKREAQSILGECGPLRIKDSIRINKQV